MRHRDMYVQPGYLIRRLHQRSTAEFAAAASGSDITQVQLSILLVVADFPGIDATRISELIGSDRTTIGHALQRLEDKRLISREVGEHDKRTKRLVLTKKGQDLSSAITQFAPAIGSAILRGLSREERKLFMQLLTKLVAENEGPKAVGQDMRVRPGVEQDPAKKSAARTVPRRGASRARRSPAIQT